jgi:hypothetical protein
MGISKFAAVAAAGLVAGASAVLSAPSACASNDIIGYINALDAAGLIANGGDLCNMIDGVCHGRFNDGPSSLPTGYGVCQQIQQGQSRDSIVYGLSHGEGLMPSSYNAPIIYDSAVAYLC